jgi:DHA3 family macrolide efflux protein-like MFS transporter
MDVVSAPQSSRPAPTVWQNRTFLFVWLGHALSVIGDGFHSVALGLWVLQTTGSGAAMGTVMAVKVLSSILLGPIAGTVADRVDRRRLMIGMDLIRTVLVGLMAYLLTGSGAPFAVLVLLSGLTAACGQLFQPAFHASLIHIVGKDLTPKASGILMATNTLGLMAGPFLGGIVVGAFGGWAAMLADAVSFLLSAVLILMGGAFASPRADGPKEAGFWADLKGGFAYIRAQPFVRGIVITAPMINFFGNALGGVLLPVVAVKVWQASTFQFGLLEGAIPLGFATGVALFTKMVSNGRRRGMWMCAGILSGAAGLTVVPLMPGLNAALPLVVACGVALALPNLLFQVALQTEIPPDVQGRVFGTISSLVSLTNPLAFLVSGGLADLFGPVTTSVGAGLMLIASVVISFLLVPELRRYD